MFSYSRDCLLIWIESPVESDLFLTCNHLRDCQLQLCLGGGDSGRGCGGPGRSGTEAVGCGRGGARGVVGAAGRGSPAAILLLQEIILTEEKLIIATSITEPRVRAAMVLPLGSRDMSPSIRVFVLCTAADSIVVFLGPGFWIAAILTCVASAVVCVHTTIVTMIAMKQTSCRRYIFTPQLIMFKPCLGFLLARDLVGNWEPWARSWGFPFDPETDCPYGAGRRCGGNQGRCGGRSRLGGGGGCFRDGGWPGGWRGFGSDGRWRWG
jgi:hypothetical protein